MIAHVGGLPVEELLGLATGGAGVALVYARAWLRRLTRSPDG